jgi:hypothetical protein
LSFLPVTVSLVDLAEGGPAEQAAGMEAAVEEVTEAVSAVEIKVYMPCYKSDLFRPATNLICFGQPQI